MSTTDYTKMIDMIIAATQFHNLEWEKDDPNSDACFSCNIGKCKASISSNYEVMLDDTTYSLALYNVEGQVFKTLRFSESEGDGKYSSLSRLYNQVLDYYYKIPESEKNIMDTLETLVPF